MRVDKNYTNVRKCPSCGQYYEIEDNEEQCVDCTAAEEYYEATLYYNEEDHNVQEK